MRFATIVGLVVLLILPAGCGGGGGGGGQPVVAGNGGGGGGNNGGGGNGGGGQQNNATYTISLFSLASSSSSYPKATFSQVGSTGVAVGNSIPAPGFLFPFSYSPGTVTQVKTPVAQTDSLGTEAVTGIDNANDVVGYVDYLTTVGQVPNVPQYYLAYITNLAGGGSSAILPGAVPSGISENGFFVSAEALGISENGQYIVGYTELLNPSANEREGTWATLWTLTNGQWVATNIPGWFQANIVNNSGQVVSGQFATFGGAALIYQNGGAAPVSGMTAANAINNAGVVAGAAPNSAGTTDAATWSNGTVTDLGSLGGKAVANSINDSGVVVGNAGTGAFIYQNGKMTDLNTLVPSGSPVLETATSINNSGDIVGVSSAGAYYLTPISAQSSAKSRSVRSR